MRDSKVFSVVAVLGALADCLWQQCTISRTERKRIAEVCLAIPKR